MLLSRSNGATSVIVRVKLLDSSVTTGAGLTGLTSASSGLIISTIADVEAAATVYTVAGSTIEAVSTLGTYAAPTATKCRFKEVDSTNHKGVYELHFADARFAISGAKHLLVSLLGATNLQQTDFVIDLFAGADIRYTGGTAYTSGAIPAAAAGASGGLLISGSNAGTTTLAALTVTGATTLTGAVTAAAGVAITNSTTNGPGLSVAGNGTGAGILATGGATGIGVSAVGGATSGSAIKATGTAGNAIALELVGQGSAAGLKTTGGATGNGATFAGGGTSGHGLQATTVGSNEIDADITGTLSAVATGVQTAIAGKVWDEAVSGHVTAGSFGATHQTPSSGTAQAGASTTITLVSGASAVNDFYKNDLVYILSGTGAGQSRFISAYVGSTKVATVSAWATNPDATSVYVILPFGAIAGATAPTASEVAVAVWDELRASHVSAGSFGQYFATVFRSGTAQAGTSSSITLDASASATNDLYKYSIISVVGGTGAGQSRQINGYTGSSKVATVGVNWTTAPSSDSVFLITPLGVDAATVAAIASAVWEELRASHVAAGSFGEYVTADSARIGGSSTAGTNAKNAFDGSTGYGFTACTMPTVTTVTTVSALAANSVNASALATDAVTEMQTGLATSSALTAAAADVTTILGQTGTTGVVVAAASKTGYTLSNTGVDALFTRQLTESYATDGSAPTVAQALMQIQQMLTEFAISSTTVTVKKLDGSTTAMTLTLNSASAPTSLTRSG
jgi:hypothetical protein